LHFFFDFFQATPFLPLRRAVHFDMLNVSLVEAGWGRNETEKKKQSRAKKRHHQIVQNDGSEKFSFYGLVRV
jgi:hypothetical protein